ncbi:hypothetical protein [Sphingomonas sp. SUN039]|uniref:hypothetical protein n=1 Tax=Sphingomonas sp. SUN039 TaxID=2937787 RepID=UPI0021649F65|nr:hypothetical protein [Sphingomonas sp. SUN039]UVO55274.1 hypothetical protein M0209_14480 [Sphingomonas sp. SUN039]
MADTQIDPPDRLIFIYNADGGIAQAIMDSVHKTLSPSTYPCSLCAITYGAFTMDPRWRAWLKALPVPSMFYHKDDSPYRDLALPVVLVERSGQVETLVSAERLDLLSTVDALIAEIEARLQK